MKLVLLPGLDGTGQFLTEFSAIFPGTCQIIRYPTHMTRYADLQDWLTPLLPQEPFVLIAESFAGPLAIRIAANTPEHLKALILVASFAKPPRPLPAITAQLLKIVPLGFKPATRLMLRVVMGRHASSQFQTEFHNSIKDIPRSTLANRLAQVLTSDHTDLLSKITIPRLYLQASQDWLVPKSAANPFIHHWGAACIRQVKAPHFALQSHPGECAKYINDFIDRLDEVGQLHD
ncbi:alpha/beta fold hydrolase [Parasulfitobacter algicola]|uniref:Alpha/beta hydrolase n=1 Tax=Parasulfitobacter algicola TaxID=2614809 RepID=A0ABX2IP47_9RHOB|nr:alpha/beta hydrolase [Sulfitobacter algicola]NSX54330.1 alpha/beta hydrolase [Sulfitobacter algicola]